MNVVTNSTNIQFSMMIVVVHNMNFIVNINGEIIYNSQPILLMGP